HPDTTSWVYKPHPHLEAEVIARGYMSADEYGEYIARWRKLPNASVYLSGDYTDIFMTSDCIINDSISFIAEYMYTHKPMLLLRNKSMGYNAFGQKAVSHVYVCRGDDIEGIFEFIENVRLGRDSLKDGREQFFSENLDYYHIRGQRAGEYIAARISDFLGA
ncbi:MAG: hypothetical protein NC311_17425, partial [Muribaculaceae bacterium]|nr:hypothetical protein [Muribaculaceae bacterium]